MTCPTCDARMSKIGAGETAVFWCPRCGTLSNCPVDGCSTQPALVSRCRQFEKLPQMVNLAGQVATQWRQLGIAESVNRPPYRHEP